MAIGDLIVSRFAINNNYQPASGVEVMVTYVGGESAPTVAGYDGTNTDGQQLFVAARELRFPVTNGNYVRCTAGGAGWIRGVQTK